MRILHVNKYYAPHVGGIETVVGDCVRALYGDVLCCQEKGGSVVDNVDGARVFRARSFGEVFSLPVSVDFFVQFAKLVNQYDLVLIHHPFPLANIAHVLFAKRKKVILWYHSDIVRQRFFGWLFSPILWLSLCFSKRILVASQALKQYSRALQPWSKKVVVIPFGINTQAYAKTPSTQAPVSAIKDRFGNKIVLSVGRLVYYKGYEYLVRAMVGVPSASLVIVGEGPLRAKLVELIEELGISNRVSILPHQQDLLPYYFASSVFVLPSISRAEAFGLVQLEAMACGLPVINTDLNTGVSEVGVSGVTGYTVPPGDLAALTLAIDKVLKDNKTREQMSQASLLRVREHYSMSLFEERIKELFKEVEAE